MCKAWEKNLADARQEGIKQRIEQGKKRGIEQGSEMNTKAKNGNQMW